MNQALSPRHLKFRPLVASLALAALMAGAQAQQVLPSGLQVAAGQASAQAQGGVLTVTNSANAILNWQSFSIGAQNAVRFVQPGAGSQVLNRVTGNDPSSILGSLSSNGRVWLINPNGVLFGQGARIDVAGLVTSTLKIANEDWLAGRYRLGSDGAAAAGIVNQGELRTSFGGRVALVGGSVENQGLIEAPGGQVLLAAGRSVELVDTGAPNLAVRITAPQGDALNLGTLSAAGGRIDVLGAAVNQQGLVRADALSVGPGGEVVLQASERLTLAAGSVTSADAAAGQGGRIKLLGREVGLFDGAAVSASGRDGGGLILAGGGAMGRDASVPNAQALFFGREASLAADALGQGDGGQIVLWSDLATRAFGRLSAHGGANGGNGGFIETSGGWLDARPARLDLGAPRGRAGTWLLDPHNITITDGGSGVDTGYDANFTAIADNAIITTAFLDSVLSQDTNVTVFTGNTGGQAGNITVTNANFLPSNSQPVTLTLRAAGDIVFNNANFVAGSGSSSSGSPPVHLTAEAGLGGSGAISLVNSLLQTSGGNVVLGGPNGGAAIGHAGLPDGVMFFISTIDTRPVGVGVGPAGNVRINGSTTEPGGRGVYFAPDTVQFRNNLVQSNDFSITGGSAGGRGVQIDALGLQAAGAISIVGSGTDGIYFANSGSPQVSLSAASINLNGSSTGTGYGLYMTTAPSSGTMVNVSTGDFQARGQNTPGGANALEIVGTGTQMFTLANGSMTLDAAGGSALLSNLDLTVGGAAMTVQASRDIVLDNVGVQSGNRPLNVTLQSAGSGVGAISLDGASFTTNGGNVTLGGPNGGAAIGHAGLPDGVKIVASTISAGSGDIALRGSTAEVDGRGVYFAADTAGSSSNDVTSTNNFTVSGASVNGRGVEIGDLYLQRGQGAISITGSGADGLHITNQGFPRVYLWGASVALSGTASGAGNGVYIDSTAAGSNSTLVYTSAGDVSITGTKNQAGGDALTLLGAGSGNMLSVGGNATLNAVGGALQIAGAGITAQAIGLYADTINLLGATTLNASAAGTAIQIAGPLNSQSGAVDQPLSIFDNRAGSGALALSASGYSRWLIWSVGPVGSEGLNLGGLSYGFQRYGATALADAANDFGSGVASSTAQFAVMNGTVAARAYDGTTGASLGNLGFTLGVAGDTPASVGSYTAAFASKNAGTQAVSLSFSAPPGFADAGGHPVYGYTLQSNASGSITPALLSATVSAANKVYDATTAATLSVGALTGLVGSETVLVSATGNFVDKNAGTAKAVTASYLLGDGSNGGLAGNYQFQAPPASITASITPAPIGFNATALDKVYDAQRTATLSNPVITPLGSDQLTLTGGTALFSDKNVGTGKAVSISGASLAGADAGNYSLVAPTGLSASITPAPLSLSATALSRSYDGTTAAQLSGLGITPLAGDLVTLNAGSASFADKNAGSAKAVSLAGFSIAGVDAANYVLAAPSGLTASITPAILSATVSAANKVYDGSASATLSLGALSGLVGSESVGVSASGSFANPNVGTAKPVAASYLLSNGSNGGLAANYRFQPATSPITAAITPATLSYLADPFLVQGDIAFPSFTGTVGGFVGGDTLATATSGSALFQASVSSGSLPGIYAINGSGLSAANYVFVQDAANATALVIVPGVSPAQPPAQATTASMQQVLQTALPQPTTQSTVNTGLLDITSSASSTSTTSTSTPTASTSTSTSTTTASTTSTPASSAAATSASASTTAFSPQPIADMSTAGVANLIGQRAAYKRTLFASSIRRLEQNPDLADLPTCRTLQEVAEGKCLVTEDLKRKAQAERLALANAPAAPAPAAAPKSAAPAAAPAAAAVAAPAPSVARALDFPQFGKRHVVQAALPQIARKIAVLIGAGNYQDPRMPSLANALGDARAVADLLGQEFGYETVVIANADRASVVAALNRLALEVGPQDSVIVYYAGHGELVSGATPDVSNGYWQLVDSRPDKPESWLSNNDIARLLGQIGASQVALISDSCYSGALAGGERLRAVPGVPDPATLLARRSVVVMSSGGNEPVFDSGKQGHSPFAWNLMSTLKQVSAWQPGGNVFERVRFAVARELPQRPQYAAAAGHQQGGDYLFERRQLDAASL